MFQMIFLGRNLKMNENVSTEWDNIWLNISFSRMKTEVVVVIEVAYIGHLEKKEQWVNRNADEQTNMLILFSVFKR